MIYELKNTEFDIARPLFSNFEDYQLILLSVFERNKSGRIFVNDKDNPKSGFSYLGQVFFIFAGSARNTDFSNEVRKILERDIFPNYKGHLSWFMVFYDPEWTEEIKNLFGDLSIGDGAYYEINRNERKECDSTLSPDFTIERVDKEFIEEKAYTIPEDIRIERWLSGMWESLDKFYERGFAFSIVYKKKLVVSFCHCSYLSNDNNRCEIGIATESNFRRKGLGKNLVFHTLNHCWEEGIERVGWHTDKENIASCKLAESVGFKFNRMYDIYYGSWP